MGALDNLLALTDPNKQREQAKAAAPKRGALDALLAQTDPGRNPGTVEGAAGSFQRGVKSLGQAVDAYSFMDAMGGAQAADNKAQSITHTQSAVPELRREDFDKYGAEADVRYRRALGDRRLMRDVRQSAILRQQEEAKASRKDATGLLQQIATTKREIDAIPQSRGKEEFDRAEGLGASLKAVARHPLDIISGVVAESVPASVPSLVGGAVGSLGGPAGTALGAGAPSMMVEYASNLAQELQAQGIDPTDAKSVEALLNDPEKLAAMRDKALKRGVPVAMLDALSAGIAGQLFRAPAKTVAKRIAHGATELGAQAGLGGAGEALGALNAGEKVDAKAVLAEMLGEAGTGGVEVATGVVRDRLQGKSDSKISEDTGRNVPEAVETLKAQQQALVDGRQRAQMFPKGTEELALPKGMARVETERGVFHFNPVQIGASDVVRASEAGRENDILGLGPASKADVEARAAKGEPLGSVVESTPDGREVKAAMVTPSTAQAAAAELNARKAPGNTVALKNPADVVQARTGGGLVADMLAKDTDAAKERLMAQAREQLERDARKQEAAGKRARFDETITSAGKIFRDPQATFSQVQGALEAARFYAEDNSLGLTQEQREMAQRATATLQPALDRLKAAEDARRDTESQARQQAEAVVDAERKARIAADKLALKTAEAAGIGADGQTDYGRLTDDQLGERASKGDARASKEMDRRVMMGDQPQRENLRDVLAELKLPATDAKLGAELQLLKQEVKGGEVARYFSTKKDSLDRVALALQERGFSQIRTPDDVIKFAGIALRGKPVWASEPGRAEVDFSRAAPKRPVMDKAAQERTLQGLRRSSPELLREYDIEAGLVGDILKKYAAESGKRLGPVPDDVRAAVTRSEGRRGLIALAAEAFESREKVAALTSHEIAHVYFDTLSADTRSLLRELREREMLGKTGPLYDDAGNVRSELAGVEDDSEWGMKEWFAERVARLNEAWAEGRIAKAEKAGDSLLRRLAYELREFVRRVWESIAKQRGMDLDSDLFETQFRRFWLRGADADVAREASTAYAQQVEFARKLTLAPETAAKKIIIVQAVAQPVPGKSIREMREAARVMAATFLNKPIRNDESGEAITITKDSLSHGFSRHGAAHVQIVPSLPELVRTAQLLSTEPHAPADGQIKAVHRYAGAVRFGEKMHRVKLTVKERRDGSRLYDHEATEIETPGGNLPVQGSEKPSTGPSLGATITIGELFGKGKAAEGQALEVDFARQEDEELSAAERELESLREGASQEDAADIEARGAALTEKIAELKKRPAKKGPMADDEVAAAVKPASALEEKAKNRPANERPAKTAEERVEDPAWLPKAEELDTAEVIAKADKVEALPPVDRKAALMELLWHKQDQAKKMRAKDSLQGDIDAQWQEKDANRLRATLDKEFPGWGADKSTGDAADKPTQSGKPPAPPAPPETSEAALPDDGEPSPFLPKDEPLPVRAGKAAEVYGHSGVTPSAVFKTWDKVRDVFAGIRGAVPELPTFAAAKWNASDSFIREQGTAFYNRVKEGYRQLRTINDYVQKNAEENVARITKPLIRAGEFNPAAYKRLMNLQEQARIAKADGRSLSKSQLATIDALNAQVESSPYVIFQKLVLMLDLNWRQQNLKDSAGNPIRLPADINQAEIAAELKRLAAAMETSPHRDIIAQALERHMALVKQTSADLKKRDLLAADHLENPYYFPHITVETTRGGKTEQRDLAPERVRPGTEADFRGYLIDPVGSAKAIETDYVRAMYYHLVQVGAHNEKADIVQDYFRHYDVKKDVEARAKKLSRERAVPVSWEQAFHEEYAPNGYVLYGTDSRDAFPTVSIDRDKLARRLGVALTSEDLHKQMEQLGLKGVRLLPEDLKESMEMGARETWVVPARVAEALRGIAKRETHSDKAWDAAMKFVIGAWKRWKLFMPHNHIRYEFGNMTADLEKIFSADPEVFKYLGPAAKELREFWRGGVAGDDLRAALKEGVLNAPTAQEVNGLANLPNFKEFQTKAESAWTQVKKRGSSVLLQPILAPLGLGNLSSVEASALREAITRYAKWKADYTRLRNGSRPVYAGAYWKEVEAMGDSSPGANDANARKAGAISKATFGDYSDTSVLGQTLREKFIPFYSWLEVNFKYHANLFRNLRDMVKRGEKTRAQALGQGAKAATTFTARAAAGFALRLALPYVAVALWNNSGDREELEDQLSEEDKRRFHIILGKDEDGKVQIAYAPTAFMDVMKWFSGPEAMRGATAWMKGQTDFATAFDSWRARLLPDLLNNAVGQAGPLAQVPVALGTKKRMFPDVTDPRTIPEYDMRRAILSMVTDEFTADMLERAVNKDYYAPKDFGDWSKQLILQVRQRDPEAWAYYEIRDKAADFMEERTGAKRDTSYDAPDQQVLRNFRKAIYQGDVPAAMKFYQRALEYGYTAERFAASVRAQDPLATLAKKDGLRKEFVEELSPFDREQLKRAFMYYDRMNGMRGKEKQIFPSERGGDAAQKSFTARPRYQHVQGLADAWERRSEEETRRRAEQAEKRSLAPSR